MTDFIDVLWVEDDPVVIESYPLEAELYGLRLVPFTCWDDAEKALKREPNRWPAIILDAKCRHHSDSVANASCFLINVTNAITKICHGRKFVPWYILSGQAETDIKELIPETRQEWDGDWKKPFYDKNTDREILFRRIRDVARGSKPASLKIHEMYKNVYDAINELGLDNNVGVNLTSLLSELHFPEDYDNNSNNQFTKARTTIELIYRHMTDNGMLPRRKKINLGWSTFILNGQSVYKKDNLVVEVYKSVFPKIIGKIVWNMIDVGNKDAHATEELKDYLNVIGGTSYLPYSFALQLCDVILWYKGYVSNYSNKKENATNWDVKDQDAWNGN